jgi:hypothetical protein
MSFLGARPSHPPRSRRPGCFSCCGVARALAHTVTHHARDIKRTARPEHLAMGLSVSLPASEASLDGPLTELSTRQYSNAG